MIVPGRYLRSKALMRVSEEAQPKVQQLFGKPMEELFHQLVLREGQTHEKAGKFRFEINPLKIHNNGYLHSIKFKLAYLQLIVAKIKREMLVPILKTRPFSKQMSIKHLYQRYSITGRQVSHYSNKTKCTKVYMHSTKACAKAASTQIVVLRILQQHSSVDRFTIASIMTRTLSDPSIYTISIVCKNADENSYLKMT